MQRVCTKYNVDILFLQETWLTDANSHIISNSLSDYVVTHTSAMEHKITSGMLVGRPFGGTAESRFIENLQDFALPCFHVTHA